MFRGLEENQPKNYNVKKIGKADGKDKHIHSAESDHTGQLIKKKMFFFFWIRTVLFLKKVVAHGECE